jgi:vacuolar-type H+-ATPase subunit I/STV1
MGVFIWHQWAQFVGIFASIYTIWAGIWGIFFRKFFWDFVNGTVMPGPNNANNGRPCFDNNPCGIIPAKSDSIFITLIVTAPIIQIISIAFGITHLFVELAPQIRKYRVYRSWAARIVTYTLQSFFAVLFYQGTNGALYSFVAVIGFTVAQFKGEVIEEAKQQRGRGDAEGGGVKA